MPLSHLVNWSKPGDLSDFILSLFYCDSLVTTMWPATTLKRAVKFNHLIVDLESFMDQTTSGCQVSFPKGLVIQLCI